MRYRVMLAKNGATYAYLTAEKLFIIHADSKNTHWTILAIGLMPEDLIAAWKKMLVNWNTRDRLSAYSVRVDQWWIDTRKQNI